MVRSVSFSDYAAIERPSLDWLIPGVLPRPGLVLLLGEPFAGKSYLAVRVITSSRWYVHAQTLCGITSVVSTV
jgi:hypothetical protein